MVIKDNIPANKFITDRLTNTLFEVVPGFDYIRIDLSTQVTEMPYLGTYLSIITTDFVQRSLVKILRRYFKVGEKGFCFRF